MDKNYEKKQYEEQQETNMVLWINTTATIIAALTGILIVWLQLKK